MPNELIILGYIAGLFLNVQSFKLVGIGLFIIKAILPVLILMLLYHFKGIGSGDIKLFSVMSALVGIECTKNVMVVSVMLAGIAVLFIFLLERNIDLKRRLHYSFYITAAFFIQQIHVL